MSISGYGLVQEIPFTVYHGVTEETLYQHHVMSISGWVWVVPLTRDTSISGWIREITYQRHHQHKKPRI
jgi:hypothetical protein